MSDYYDPGQGLDDAPIPDQPFGPGHAPFDPAHAPFCDPGHDEQFDLGHAPFDPGHHEQFDPVHQQWHGAGDPAADVRDWHRQETLDSCAVASQEFVLDELTGQHFSEGQLRTEAWANGWYTPGGGTPLYDTGKLLEAHGLHVKQEQGATIDELSSALAHGEKVLACVDGEKIWAPGAGFGSLDSYPGIPGQAASRIVEVIGIDQNSPNGPVAVLNDPYPSDGRGMVVPLDQFQAAWQYSGGFAVIAAPGDSSQQVSAHVAVPVWPREPLFGGHYNGDGTYHYDSDNTDRDPQTGAIVRRY